jgi:small-conductance mechanosensitive channel
MSRGPPSLSLPADPEVVTVAAVVAVALAAVVVPRVAGALRSAAVAVLRRRGLHDAAAEWWSYTPPGFSMRGFVRSGQAAVLTACVLVLLDAWGYGWVVGDTARYLDAALPEISDLKGVARLLGTGLVLAATYTASQYIGASMAGITGEEDAYVGEHTREIFVRTAQLTVILGGSMTVLYLWEIQIRNLLVGAGVLGVVVGFAARATFASALSGFVLMFSRPFEVGDWIEVSGQEGRVTDMTIVNTRLRTPDAERIIVPNDIIANSEVINLTHENRLAVTVSVSVDYDTDLDHAEAVAERAVREADTVDTDAGVDVFPESFAESAIELTVRFWIDYPHPRKQWRARAAVIREIREAFESEGVRIPYPQRRVHAREEAPERARPTD